MALQDHFTDEQRDYQVGLTRSWEASQRVMADPEHRARIEQRQAELDDHEPAPMTSDEFIEWAASLRAR